MPARSADDCEYRGMWHLNAGKSVKVWVLCGVRQWCIALYSRAMTEIALILLSAVLVNNYVLTKFLGICPFLGTSGKVETAVGMSFAVMFLMSVVPSAPWLVQ